MGRPQKLPTLRFYEELKERNSHDQHNANLSESPIHPYQNNPYQTEDKTEDMAESPRLLITSIEASTIADSAGANIKTPTTTLTTTNSTQPDSSIDAIPIQADDTLPPTSLDEMKKVPHAHGASSKTSTSSAHPTSTSTSVKKRKSKPQKLSQTSLPDTAFGKMEKLSRATPVIYAEKRLQNKTALTLVHLYSQEMTPEQLELMFQYRDELQLTHSELVALSLLRDMDSANPHIKAEATKQYWKIQEIIEKSKKSATSVSPNNASLLDRTLENAQEAIFGEIIEKGVDTEN